MRRSLMMRLFVRPVWRARQTLLPDGSAHARAYVELRWRVRSLVKRSLVKPSGPIATEPKAVEET
jgi:hypothetical protein